MKCHRVIDYPNRILKQIEKWSVELTNLVEQTFANRSLTCDTGGVDSRQHGPGAMISPEAQVILPHNLAVAMPTDGTRTRVLGIWMQSRTIFASRNCVQMQHLG